MLWLFPVSQNVEVRVKMMRRFTVAVVVGSIAKARLHLPLRLVNSLPFSNDSTIHELMFLELSLSH